MGAMNESVPRFVLALVASEFRFKVEVVGASRVIQCGNSRQILSLHALHLASSVFHANVAKFPSACLLEELDAQIYAFDAVVS